MESSIDIILHSTWTVIAFVFFVGVVFWAWSGKRKSSFDEAARMALDDDKDLTTEQRRDV
jgi:cytochrome c oxidase cbb3-type subunit 4